MIRPPTSQKARGSPVLSQAAKLLKIVTKRVANKKIHEIFDGPPRTDGCNVWLPLSVPEYSFDEKVGIASHEGSHIRFKTVFGSNIHELVCPENHRVGHAVLNIFEDARVDTLLKAAYYGFWIELDKANARQVNRNLQRFSADGVEILHSNRTVDLCLHLMIAHVTGHGELLYSDAMRDASGAFKFASEPLGTFWRAFQEAHAYMAGQLTFPATVVASKRVIKALKDLLRGMDSKGTGGPPETVRGGSEGKGQADGGLQDQACPDGGAAPEEPGTGNGLPRPDGDGCQDGKKCKPARNTQRDRSLADQLVSTVTADSGINIEDADKHDRKLVAELMKRLKAAGENAEKLQKGMARLVKKESKRLGELIRDPAKDDDGPDAGDEVAIPAVDDGTGEAVVVDAIEDIVRLREFNSIDEPAKEYAAIVRENWFTIKQLKKALEHIKVAPVVQRGARRGIICHRDLPRVVSSKGRFNRPFLANQEKRGASLLIVIDESASMSVDDGLRGLVEDGGESTCPRSLDCAVRRECPDHDCCDFAGIWPKDFYLECERLDACPMDGCKGGFPDAGDCDGGISDLPIYIAKKSAIILAEALKETRIDFGVIGFSAIGGRNVIVEKVYKRLDEEANPRKLGSIWVSFESGENRDGTSFQSIAARYLRAAGRKLPVMIIISDGQPHHGGTEYVGEVAEKMTARAIKALKQHAKLFAVSIDRQGRDYLRDIYGSENYVVLDHARDITGKLIYLVKGIAAALG